jgi:hypothetical protein
MLPGTPLPAERHEFVRIARKKIPDQSMLDHNLDPLLYNNCVYFRIEKCMYGLPQAGRLSQIRLIEHLRTHGYIRSPNTPCLFRHTTRDIQFCLVVDDFCIKYGSRADADQLIQTLQSNGYELTIKDKGDTYHGMDIKVTPSTSVTLSMPGYIEKMLKPFPTQLPPSFSPSLLHTWKVNYTCLPSHPTR